MNAHEFRREGRPLIDWIADHVEGTGRWPVTPDVMPVARTTQRAHVEAAWALLERNAISPTT